MTIVADDVADIVIRTGDDDDAQDVVLEPRPRAEIRWRVRQATKSSPASEPAVRASLAVSSHTESGEIILYDPEIIISQTSLTVEEENPFTYTVRLDTEPTVEVTVGVSGHVDTDIILATTTLTFTPVELGQPPDGDG